MLAIGRTVGVEQLVILKEEDMGYSPSDGSGSNDNTPSASDLANIAQAAADIASNMPSALDFDAARGLSEPSAEDVAQQAVDEMMEEVDDYLKEVKPEIVEEMKKQAKKCGGGCSAKTQEENKKKGGSCGGVRDTAVSSSCAASLGFQPSGALTIRAELEAARKLAKETVEATASTLTKATSTLTLVPSMITTAEGTPDAAIANLTETVTELIAALGEITATLSSLIMTQDALIKNMGVGL